MRSPAAPDRCVVVSVKAPNVYDLTAMIAAETAVTVASDRVCAVGHVQGYSCAYAWYIAI